jgi:hypothetical protein
LCAALYAQQGSEQNINYFIKILLVVSLITLGGCSTENMKSVDKNKLEAEVLDTFNGLVKASKSLDPNKYFEYFNKEKFTGLNADGTVWHSIENLETLISSGFPMVERVTFLEFKNVKVTLINSTTAILVNEYTQTMLLKSGDTVNQSGGGTQVWSKFNGEWKLVSVSASEASR